MIKTIAFTIFLNLFLITNSYAAICLFGSYPAEEMEWQGPDKNAVLEKCEGNTSGNAIKWMKSECQKSTPFSDVDFYLPNGEPNPRARESLISACKDPESPRHQVMYQVFGGFIAGSAYESCLSDAGLKKVSVKVHKCKPMKLF